MSEAIYKKLRFLLQIQGVSPKVAAEHLGLPLEHMQGIADGVINPTPRQLMRLAELCRVGIDFFDDRREEERDSGRKRLTLADLAIRFQALCECLVGAQILTAAQLKQKTEEVEARTAQRTGQQEPLDGRPARPEPSPGGKKKGRLRGAKTPLEKK
ncbi:MAG TPA: hypothetical protein PKX48_09540 [Planctomycetota bacterium]|jgi:transcriptional regulator with XRE-family HTH domain|nr:hypothetical protein [Planctomycetota bacterium]OQC19807.1 MAG: hypothetical protein BWX69_02384 [Planctomycetes bacterium ADurb.Bin069]NMD35706.1 hypothetical protein [Planctomycetota bacterium]HNS00105.1 hypothetical protein [Planctomycetota bacterium]HNU26616.1 hypothetical protein [Planctomycetota bacterium]